MKEEQLILSSAQEYNILPLTSRCDAACIFCSHRQNPPQVQTVSFGPRTIPELERTMAFLDPRRTIFIGESATRITEGEPFTHPQMADVLRLLRQRFPQTPLSITTNGNQLNETMARLMGELGKIEINLSLNSASQAGWQKLMGRTDYPGGSKAAAGFLQRYGIPFHGSLVAMPGLVGWADIAETILFLDHCGAKTVRVFLPGYSRLAPPRLQFDPRQMHADLASFIRQLADSCSCPLMLEPPLLDDLRPLLIGVIKGTLADRAGLQRDDEIMAVNDLRPRSRVEAWQLLQKTGPISVQLIRNGQTETRQWINPAGERSGAVMAYDFEMARYDQMAAIFRQHQPDDVLTLCSPLGLPVMRCLPEFQAGGLLWPVTSRFFGGSIGAAGLLTVADFCQALADYCLRHPKPQMVLLPREAFDAKGIDMAGQGYWELAEKFSLQAEVI